MSLFKRKPRLPDYSPGDVVWLISAYNSSACRATVLDVTNGVYIVAQVMSGSPVPVSFKEADSMLRPRTVD